MTILQISRIVLAPTLQISRCVLKDRHYSSKRYSIRLVLDDGDEECCLKMALQPCCDQRRSIIKPQLQIQQRQRQLQQSMLMNIFPFMRTHFPHQPGSHWFPIKTEHTNVLYSETSRIVQNCHIGVLLDWDRLTSKSHQLHHFWSLWKDLVGPCGLRLGAESSRKTRIEMFHRMIKV